MQRLKTKVERKDSTEVTKIGGVGLPAFNLKKEDLK
jgi:hypothetical protein